MSSGGPSIPMCWCWTSGCLASPVSERLPRSAQEDRDQPIILFTAYLNGEARSRADELGVHCIDKRDVSDLPDAILKAVR